MAEAVAATTRDPDRVELTIGGKAYGGWTSVRIELPIDSLAASFSLALTERDPDAANPASDWPIKAGDECRVSIGGETLITGYIDVLDASLDASGHSIGASGRSKAADLIDCAAIHSPGSWSNKKLEAIAADLVKPFGLKVTAKADTGAAFKKFALQPGESVFEAIERMLKMRGLLAISTATGDVEIVSPKPEGAAVKIEQGKHFTAISGQHDVSQRFSEYRIKGQAAGDDQHNGKAVSQVKASAEDKAVTRYRPLVIVAEDQADTATLQKRAKWEATVRAAKAQSASPVMPGWRDPAGALWKPMGLVNLVAPAVWIDAELLIASVVYELEAETSSTTLSLSFPEAYSQQPVPPEAKASRIVKKGRSAKETGK